MDDLIEASAFRDVSCYNLNWLFDLCTTRNIDPQRMLRGVHWPLAHLQDPDNFIDWDSYAALISNFNKYLSETELLQASRYLWKHDNLRVDRIIGRLLFALKDQYLAAYGPLGTFEKLYPCNMSVREISPGHLEITLTMYDGCTPCHPFHIQVAGELTGLPESQGYPPATIKMTTRARGATYDVRYKSGGSLLAPLRKILLWPLAAREAARELSTTYAALLEKHRQLHQIDTRLKNAERQVAENEAKYRLLATNVSRDHAERIAIERELQDRQEIYRIVTSSAMDTIITVDQHGTITLANPASTDLFGYEVPELIGMAVDTLLPDLTLNHQLARPNSSEPGFIFTGMRKDRSQMSLEVSLAKHTLRGKRHFTAIMRDITLRTQEQSERKELERQLAASQKMESIGQLTGGIAHDFNNLLVAILGYTDLSLNKRTDPEALRKYLTEIKRAGQRAASMTQKLLAFSRRQIVEPVIINVNDLIYDLDLMIKRLLPENIQVRLSSTDESLLVMADKGQLEQVIVNLAVNARDAMPRGGRLNISAERIMVDSIATSKNPFANAGDYVLIRVSDTGIGMSDDLQARIFEPFFTTKPEGAGTGLGLAVVLGIVQQHNGFIDIQSAPAHGSSFKVYLPFTSKKPSAAASGQHMITRPARGGNETLLVVEDNQQVRELAQLILRGAGYKLVVASNGKEAVEKFKHHSDTIDLAILDVVMPRMGGREVMTKIQEIRPDIKVMFTSGYSENGVHANFILEEGLELVKKPYNTDELRSRVRKVLDQRQNRTSRGTYSAQPNSNG
ncbi:MAG: ATP-binding protein [Pseudomonadales bacterium]